MRSSRLDTLFSGNKNVPYARRHRRFPHQQYSNHPKSTNLNNQLRNGSYHVQDKNEEGELNVEFGRPQTSQGTCCYAIDQQAISSGSTGSDSAEAFLSKDLYRSVPKSDDEIPSRQVFICDPDHSNTESSFEFSEISDSECETSSKENSESQNEQDKFFNKNDLLHPNLVITKEEVLVMLMHIFMRHNLSNSALEDILRLINVVLGFSSLPNTFYSFMSYFGTQQLVRHFVCKGCGLYMGTTPEENATCVEEARKIFSFLLI
ncbi:uncharacterized protein LOC134209126 [Armigeres subalbatus]|uniref:uncharacterized protein LOC134209126 n=1 Tax=Armigeres subalbatus TaxID=124917 RepID=UPI002ED54F74